MGNRFAVCALATLTTASWTLLVGTAGNFVTSLIMEALEPPHAGEHVVLGISSASETDLLFKGYLVSISIVAVSVQAVKREMAACGPAMLIAALVTSLVPLAWFALGIAAVDLPGAASLAGIWLIPLVAFPVAWTTVHLTFRAWSRSRRNGTLWAFGALTTLFVFLAFGRFVVPF